MLMDMLHLMIGNVQGGAIDLAIFGILGGAKTHWWYAVLLGLVYFPLYYFSFRLVITRMSVETPGREAEDQRETLNSPPPLSTDERTRQIIRGLGGQPNIAEVDCCFTRLRVKVKDMNHVVDRTLMLTGARGVKRIGENDVQVIYGPQVEKIAQAVKVTLGVSS
jgi:PTS system maltose and glucose-specific IIC component